MQNILQGDQELVVVLVCQVHIQVSFYSCPNHAFICQRHIQRWRIIARFEFLELRQNGRLPVMCCKQAESNNHFDFSSSRSGMLTCRANWYKIIIICYGQAFHLAVICILFLHFVFFLLFIVFLFLWTIFDVMTKFLAIMA